MDHDLTAPLTVPVPGGEALLLDLRGCGLVEEERLGVEREVRARLEAMLDALPAETPVMLVDRVCELLGDLDGLLGINPETISYS